MDNPFAVDQAFVVSVRALRAILKEISTDGQRWWMEEDNEQSVVIGYNASVEGFNDVLVEFPKIAKVPLFLNADGEIVCLYPVSRRVVQGGLYKKDDKVLLDEVRDWETFWPPIRRALRKHCAYAIRGIQEIPE